MAPLRKQPSDAILVEKAAATLVTAPLRAHIANARNYDTPFS